VLPMGPLADLGRLSLDLVTTIRGSAEAFLDKRARRCIVKNSTLQSSDAQSRYFRKPVKEDFEADWSNVLGTGYSGSVVVASQRTTGLECALKSYNKRVLSKSQLDMLKSEIDINLSIDHPNITRLLYVYEGNDTVDLLMELCAGRELLHRLNETGVFHEPVAMEATHQMLLAVDYLHHQGIVHRDIKLENWLYDSVSDYATLKLTDFGFSRRWDRREELHGSCGSTLYMAPEVFSGCYTEKCDMWSLGVVVYLLLCGQFPFHGATESESRGKIMTCEYNFPTDRWDHISAHAKDFIRKLLVSNPAKRMSAAECLQHPWIQQVFNEQVFDESLMQQVFDESWMQTDTASKHLPVLLRTARRTRSAAQDCQAIFVKPEKV